MKNKIGAALFMAAALVACRAEPGAGVSQPQAVRTAPSGLDLIPLIIRGGGREHRFTVEVARTESEQARGMMFRDSLGPDEGMLFPFSPPRPASFWMMNTLIPLDIIFICADGTIARIAANAVPHSTDQIAVGEPVVAVLEIPGGRAAELGIEEGDVVTWNSGNAPSLME